MGDYDAAAIKGLGIKDVYVLGASQGGMIAQYIAVDYPKFIKKLVICSSLAKQNSVNLSVFSNWEKLAKNKDVKALNTALCEKILSKECYEANRQFLDSAENYGTDVELENFYYSSIASKEFDMFDSIEKIKCPTLVIGSKKDEIMTVDASVQIVEKIFAKLYIYDGFSHAVYDEAPDFVSRVTGFFNE